MTTMLQLVTSTQAKRLKALGFDWGVTAYYQHTSGDDTLEYVYQKPTNINGRSTGNWSEYSAPTVAEALKWVRDVKKIVCFTVFRHPKLGWEHCVWEPCPYGHRVVYNDRGYLTNDLAEHDLLNVVLGEIERIEQIERLEKETKK